MESEIVADGGAIVLPDVLEFLCSANAVRSTTNHKP